MARPPRIPVMLPWGCKVIYFITLCIVPRCNALANDTAWQAVCETLTRLDHWNTYCIMAMPDHIHLLTAPQERERSVAAFLKWFKRWFNESYDSREKWQWQPGGFDRLRRHVGISSRKVEQHSRESGSSWFGHTLEKVAISKRFCRR